MHNVVELILLQSQSHLIERDMDHHLGVVHVWFFVLVHFQLSSAEQQQHQQQQ